MTPSPDLSILRHLAARTHASAAEVDISCWMTGVEAHAHLVVLESMQLVTGRRELGVNRSASAPKAQHAEQFDESLGKPYSLYGFSE